MVVEILFETKQNKFRNERNQFVKKSGCTLYDTKLKYKLLDNNYKRSVQRRRSLPRKGICKAPYTNELMSNSWTRYVLQVGGRRRSWNS